MGPDDDLARLLGSDGSNGRPAIAVYVDPKARETLQPQHHGQAWTVDLGDGYWETGVTLADDVSQQDARDTVRWLQDQLERIFDHGDPAREGWARSEHGAGRWYVTIAAYPNPY